MSIRRDPSNVDADARVAPTRKRFWGWFAGVLGASGVLAAVIGTVLAQTWGNLGDEAKDVLGVDAIAVHATPPDDPRPGPPPGRVWAFGEGIASDLSSTATDDIAHLLASQHATNVGAATYGVVLESKRSETITITRIRAVVVQQSAPLSAAIVNGSYGGGGTEGPVSLWFDLDSGDLDGRAVRAKELVNERFLDNNGLILEPAEKLRFRLTRTTSKHYVEWQIEVQFVVGGKTHAITFAPPAAPFRVTAKAAGYNEYYRWAGMDFSKATKDDICVPTC